MDCKILKIKKLTEKAYDYEIEFKDAKNKVKPGQFVHIKINGFLLRRPISICEIMTNSLRLVYEVRGEGTLVLSSLKEGDNLDILAPLGNGFTILEPDKKVVIVGGGIGTPPLLEMAKRTKGIAILGFKTKDDVILKEDFERYIKTYITTDDGSLGFKGFTTDILKDILKEEDCDMIYSCGPCGMLKNSVKVADEFDKNIEVSLEERMACGVGACLVCRCLISKDGTKVSRHVCSDGPVFNGKEVIFD